MDSVFCITSICQNTGVPTRAIDYMAELRDRSNLKNQSAYFGYAAEVSLDFELTDTLNEKKIALSWPRVLFTVISLDSWSR